MHKVIFIMGVSGSGKSTIGEALSARTGFEFYDADDFHTPGNVEKMRAGTPLTDEDRWPWLDNLHEFIKQKILYPDLHMHNHQAFYKSLSMLKHTFYQSLRILFRVD